MKQQTMVLTLPVAIALSLLTVACSKKNILSDQEELHKVPLETLSNVPSSIAAKGDTLLNVTYETNTLNSGIIGLTATKASATDAAYLLSPGRTGNYAIAHKVNRTDTAYFSNEAYRSEADADNVAAARFLPGDERRYEFSVFLKDWEEWNPSAPAYGDNIFQLKVSGGALVPVRILPKRNAIVMRHTDFQDNLLGDLRPYVNQWIDFRIDILYSSTNTGYLKVYIRLPGALDYTLQFQKDNYKTYTGTGLTGQHGYIKWGVYREVGPLAPVTRIAYHDDIRIIKLPL